MSKKDVSEKLVSRALLLGVMSGMRSMAGLATISRRAAEHPRKFKNTIFAPLASENVANLASLAQIGEIIADKMPFVPNRIAPLPLLGRFLLGGISGAVVYAEGKESPLSGAVLGGLSAVASTFVFYFLRRNVAKLLHLPDLPVALAEDAGMFWLGQKVMESYE